MSDRRTDLVDLFVRDLDGIELPPRDRWRPAPRKETPLMRTGRYLLYAGAAAAVLAFALIASFALRDRTQVSTSPTPSASSSPVSSSSPSASPTGTPASSLNPAGFRYVSPTLGYAIATPPPWHRSTCAAPFITQEGSTPVNDVFVSVSAYDEHSSDIGPPYTTLRIFVESNPQNLTARQWAEQGKSVGGQAGERVEDVTYAGRPAARKSIPLSDPSGTVFRYFVANGGRMYVVDPDLRPPLDAATRQTLAQMIDSFGFTSEAEQAQVAAALRTPPLLPRSPEEVADGIAAALAAKDVDALAGFLARCPFTAGENAGGTSVSREKYLDDLRMAFAAGLVVTVQPRPLDGDRAKGQVTIASTWRDSRGTQDRKLVITKGESDRWEWQGMIGQRLH